MTKQDSIIITEDGEVLDQSSLVPMGDGSSLKELVPYNRLTNIAKSTLTRLTWDKKRGLWTCSLGEFDALNLIPKAATELYAVWSEQVGKPAYYGTSEEDAAQYGEAEKGYRVAFAEETIGPAYGDFFGLSRDFAEAVCKFGATNPGNPIKVKGNTAINTQNGTFYVPKIVR